jgi:hypothetical protein
MHTKLIRSIFALLTLTSTLLLAGCAEFAEGLAAAAEGMRQQQGAYGNDDYVHTPRNTSAAGIK